jgi:PAS domain S-box-containing protein
MRIPAQRRAVGAIETDRTREGDDRSPADEATSAGARPDEQFRRIVEKISAPIYVVDVDGRLTFCNEAATALWGRRPPLGETRWCGSWRLYWPDGSPLAPDECALAVTLKTREPVRGAEAIAERPNGERVPFLAEPMLLFDADGALAGAVNLLTDLKDRKWNDEDAQRLAAIVSSSDDGIISKDLNGVITSWNAGAGRIFGYAADEIIGKPVTVLIPRDRHDEEPGILGRILRGERIDHYETIRQRKDGTRIDISLTVSPIRNAEGKITGASKIARDITGQKRIEAQLRRQTLRLATLNDISKKISRDLDLDRTIRAVIDTATEVAGAEFGAFCYDAVGADGAAHMVFATCGAPPEVFENLATSTFQDTRLVRSDDVRTDPQIVGGLIEGEASEPNSGLSSYLAAPVIGRTGEVLGGIFVGHSKAGVFNREAEDILMGIAAHAAIAMDNARLHRLLQDEVAQRRRAEEAKELLLNEMKHRVKNSLATVMAIARQTFRDSSTGARAAFDARIQALASAHDLLTLRNWDGASVEAVVESALDPFRERNRERFRVSGPPASLDPNKALMTSMILHELGTNAVKYGAFSNAEGVVSVEWELSAKRDCLRLQWRESGGPPVQPPQRRGFGSMMIERSMEGHGGATRIEFAPTGVVYDLAIPL